eukprot:800413-Rhodomonas_salina.1
MSGPDVRDCTNRRLVLPLPRFSLRRFGPHPQGTLLAVSGSSLVPIVRLCGVLIWEGVVYTCAGPGAAEPGGAAVRLHGGRRQDQDRIESWPRRDCLRARREWGGEGRMGARSGWGGVWGLATVLLGSEAISARLGGSREWPDPCRGPSPKTVEVDATTKARTGRHHSCLAPFVAMVIRMVARAGRWRFALA